MDAVFAVQPVSAIRYGLAQGKIFNQRGELLAVAMQEGLTRTLHPDSDGSSANGNWQNV